MVCIVAHVVSFTSDLRLFWKIPWTNGCFSKNRGLKPPKWMVKIMEKPLLKWMIWGYHYFRKHPNLHQILLWDHWEKWISRGFSGDSLRHGFFGDISIGLAFGHIDMDILGISSRAKKKEAPVCSGYIGDEKLPSYVGIVIHHYEDPGSLLNHQYFMESIRVFVFSWLTVSFRGLNQSLLNATEQTSFFPRFFRRWHFVEQAAKGGKISQFGYLSYP